MKNFYFLFFIVCFLFFAQVKSQTVSPCMNEDFEATQAGLYSGSANATAISGWSISSQNQSSGLCGANSFTSGSPEAWILSAPVYSLPGIGTLSTSPLGGTNILQINDANASGNQTRASHNYSVTNSNPIFQFAYAACLQSTSHLCCVSPEFNVEVYDCTGARIICDSLILNTVSGCSSMASIDGYTTVTAPLYGSVIYTNWQVKYIDLTDYIGSCVTVVFTVRDCTAGGHFGFAYIDAHCDTQVAGTSLVDFITSTNSISFCGSNQAIINAPVGYSSYQWVSPTGTVVGATGTSYTISNPAVGDMYRAILTPSAGCNRIATYTIVNTTVNIPGVITGSSCNQGSTGAATVMASGSSIGYNYTWLDTANTIVGNSSVLTNMVPGIYTASVSAAGCGSASTTLSIGEAPQSIVQVTMPYCGTYANLSAPTAGSGFRWYHGATFLPGNTTSTFTVSTAMNGESYWLSYQNNIGCRDSVQSILTQTNNATIGVNINGLACAGSNSVDVTVSLSNTGTSGSNNFFYLNSVGNTPAYSSSLDPTALFSYSVANLSTAGVYTVFASDGSCLYGETFTITPSVPAFTYSLSQPSSTLCSGEYFHVAVNIANPLHYSFAWSPNTFVTNSGNQNFVITQTVSTGSMSNIIYTVIVTPTAVNCPQSQTITVAFANPATPTISIIPSLCTAGSDYTVSVNPTGGLFSTVFNNTTVIGQTNGIISPSLAGMGVHSFMYTNYTGSCSAVSTATYVVHDSPLVSVSGSDLICAGETATLMAIGADSFLWNTSAIGASISVSPINTTIYTVIGTSSATGCFAAKTKTVDVEPCTEISANTKDTDLKIYPNPAVNELTIETQSQIVITMYNEVGIVLLQTNLQKGKSVIDLTSFSNGIYLLKASGINGIKVTKIIKEK